MKPRTFAALAIVTVVVLALAIATYAAQNRWLQPKVSGVALLPGLTQQAPRIARIEIAQGGKAVALARDKEGWSLADRGGYPAKTEAVRTLLVKLAQTEQVEGKTRNKDRYQLLELEDPAGKDAKSRLLRLLDDKGSALAELIVGKKRHDAFGANKGGTYVRKPGDEQTWLTNTELEPSVSVRDWVQTSLIDLGAAKIAKVTVEIPGEEPLAIARDAADAKKYALVGMPEDKKLKEGSGLEDIVRAAGSLDFEDVRKAAATMAGGNVSVVRIEADGGLAVTLRLRKEGDDNWLALEASGGDTDEAKKTAEDIAKRAQGWEFRIAPGKAQAILKRRADLFQAS
jgi:uncharacterized protein DUF4340